jgi:hypothetical protein
MAEEPGLEVRLLLISDEGEVGSFFMMAWRGSKIRLWFSKIMQVIRADSNSPHARSPPRFWNVIALLDKAKELGCLDSVSDEGGFWEKRDVAELVNEIGSRNQMLAAFGGKLNDVFGDGIEIRSASIRTSSSSNSQARSHCLPKSNSWSGSSNRSAGKADPQIPNRNAPA